MMIQRIIVRAMQATILAGGLSSFVFATGQSPSICEDANQVAGRALHAATELKTGDTRADVERNFQLDGGLQVQGKSRYVYKRWPLIKIDVEFSNQRTSDQSDSLPGDRVVRVSRPYLEYPYAD
jgi:hypothetical protein